MVWQEAEALAMKADPGPQVDELLSQVYSNRSFAQLMLKNYGSCKEDANRALTRNPNNVKALYRKARVSADIDVYRSNSATSTPPGCLLREDLGKSLGKWIQLNALSHLQPVILMASGMLSSQAIRGCRFSM